MYESDAYQLPCSASLPNVALPRKLGQRLALKNKIEEELRGRIDQLEKRQTQDDAVINVINRSVPGIPQHTAFVVYPLFSSCHLLKNIVSTTLDIISLWYLLNWSII